MESAAARIPKAAREQFVLVLEASGGIDEPFVAVECAVSTALVMPSSDTARCGIEVAAAGTADTAVDIVVEPEASDIDHAAAEARGKHAIARELGMQAEHGIAAGFAVPVEAVDDFGTAGTAVVHAPAEGVEGMDGQLALAAAVQLDSAQI